MIVSTATEARIGYDDVGRGAVLVLLHAFPLGRAMWRPQLEALGIDHRLVAPDLRGFGESQPPAEPATIEAMADDVNSLLDTLRIREPIALGGLSMGGYVALAFAKRHGARLRALILADTRAEADTPEGRVNRDALIAKARTQPASEIVESMLPKLLGATTRRERLDVVDEVRRLGSAHPSEGIVAALRALRDRPDATPSLRALHVPTLVIVGAEDVITPLDAARVLSEGIVGAKLQVIPGAGHLTSLERPLEFNAVVREFLGSL